MNQSQKISIVVYYASRGNMYKKKIDKYLIGAGYTLYRGVHVDTQQARVCVDFQDNTMADANTNRKCSLPQSQQNRFISRTLEQTARNHKVSWTNVLECARLLPNMGWSGLALAFILH